MFPIAERNPPYDVALYSPFQRHLLSSQVGFHESRFDPF